jgi:hypothetical protein
MQDSNTIPRWVVENDPSWEKTIDSDLGLLRWTKKGTGITAVCPANSMVCELRGHDQSGAGLSDISAAVSRMQRQSASGVGDIAKYLSSRYLNPGINGPRFDLRKFRTS